MAMIKSKFKHGQLVTINNSVYRVVRAEPHTICGGCAFDERGSIERYRGCFSIPGNIHRRLSIGYVFKRIEYEKSRE